MANKKLPYGVKNHLDSFILKEIEKIKAKTGIKVNKGDIMDEVAEYCSVTYENIDRIKKGYSKPSLGVALKMAEYFNVKVEDIFKIC